ncbi:MAG: metallophosphoesterase [Syntrophobacteraceae bacterium]|jgi:Icc-related predicted phosphoesterase|nr:metallophosphoesterase [Syntrophobacteraceae bacterium]
MKMLFTSDTHVYPGHLKRLLKAAAHLRPDIVVLGGDLIPDWRRTIRDSIPSHQAWAREKLLPAVENFRRTHPEIRVFLDLGNDDLAAAGPLLESRDGIDFELLHGRVVEISPQLALVGYMAVSPTPFGIKDREKPDCRDWTGLSIPGVRKEGETTVSGTAASCTLDPADGTMEDDLDGLSDVLGSSSWKSHDFLFVSHCPPRGTALDLTSMHAHVGSLAVRRFIEGWAASGRLRASFHGHIHESPRMSGRVMEPFGSVPAFNVGQEMDLLHALFLETDHPMASARIVTVDRSGLPKLRVISSGGDT